MRKFFIVLFVLTVLFGIVALWWYRGISPVDKKSPQRKIFVVQKGEGIRSIAKRLKEEGLIQDQIVFFILVKGLGLDGKIQAGDFRLSPSMDTRTLAVEFTHGTLDVWVTIPEGLRSEEVAQILKNKVPTYKDSWLTELKKNEGYLFPDTYLLPKDADVALVVKIMRSNFEKKLEDIQGKEDARWGTLDLEEVVILASIIEREAKFTEDRPLVAGVLLNRLRRSIPLQADATVQYAVGEVKSNQGSTWWKKRLTKEDLKTSSPFNTYIQYGLPPTPIANPGLLSLKAASSPFKTNYLYYLSSEDGRMHYAETLEEHNRNIEKYL